MKTLLDRDSLAGSACPPFEFDDAESLRIETGRVRLAVRRPPCLESSARIDGEWRAFAEDRPTGAILLGVADGESTIELRGQPLRDGDRFALIGD